MNNLIKILTAGSVDDGKSTLLGHLLSNINAIYEDQIEGAYNNGVLDYSLLLDGLSSEREQGITIDVCYRYFYLNNNKIVLADVPGHEQYTHNMITAATFSDLAILLIDARNGVLTQTKRHSYILSMLGVKNIIIAVNKMDLVNYSENIYNNIKNEYEKLNEYYNFNINFIPISALFGDNITEKSNNMLWYNGNTIYDSILNINSTYENYENFLLPVQYVFKNEDIRYYCGKIKGEISVGDEVIILPSNFKSKITSIYSNGLITNNTKNTNVSISLEDEIDISRGDIIIKNYNYKITNNVECQLIWFNDIKLNENKYYYIKHLNKIKKCKIVIKNKIDINNNQFTNNDIIKLNDIFYGNVHLTENIICDIYNNDKDLGSFIIIDSETNDTCGAGIINNIGLISEDSGMLLNLKEISDKEDEIVVMTKLILYINNKFNLDIKIK